MLSQDMRVDAQRHGRIGVAKPGGDDVHRDAGQQQRGGVQVTQVVHACVRQRP